MIKANTTGNLIAMKMGNGRFQINKKRYNVLSFYLEVTETDRKTGLEVKTTVYPKDIGLGNYYGNPNKFFELATAKLGYNPKQITGYYYLINGSEKQLEKNCAYIEKNWN